MRPSEKRRRDLILGGLAVCSATVLVAGLYLIRRKQRLEREELELKREKLRLQPVSVPGIVGLVLMSVCLLCVMFCNYSSRAVRISCGVSSLSLMYLVAEYVSVIVVCSFISLALLATTTTFYYDYYCTHIHTYTHTRADLV